MSLFVGLLRYRVQYSRSIRSPYSTPSASPYTERTGTHTRHSHRAHSHSTQEISHLFAPPGARPPRQTSQSSRHTHGSRRRRGAPPPAPVSESSTSKKSAKTRNRPCATVRTAKKAYTTERYPPHERHGEVRSTNTLCNTSGRSPPNRGHLSASTPSPSGLAPVYKSSLRRVSTDTDTDKWEYKKRYGSLKSHEIRSRDKCTSRISGTYLAILVSAFDRTTLTMVGGGRRGPCLAWAGRGYVCASFPPAAATAYMLARRGGLLV